MDSPPAVDGGADAQCVAFLSNVFWGTVASTVLLGVSLCQGYFYFSHNDDRLALKLYVTALLLLDISSSIVWSIGLRKSLLKSSVYAYIAPYAAAESVGTLAIAFLTQIFFAHRVYIFGSNRPVIPTIIVIFALVGFVAGLNRVTFGLTSAMDMIETRTFKILNVFEIGFAAMSDIVATVAMCFLLVEFAMDTRRAASLLRHMIMYTVNRGLVVTLIQVLLLALYLRDSLGLSWIPFHMVIGKLYVNTFLAMLNSRRRLKAKSSFPNHSGITAISSTIVVSARVNSAGNMTAALDRMPSTAQQQEF
ncbi:hypothetical protein BD410DRAFT_793087 [Rickenella mellea]|uniref:DUF6534 domain-containing protein n=1 Tax=Rickenella mellea TaxID=50990 RepID=A0A4Y7PT38_9AGAM|nr:hypothetical protein BD410DRAFT_793087 [Rickenella mellea]